MPSSSRWSRGGLRCPAVTLLAMTVMSACTTAHHNDGARTPAPSATSLQAAPAFARQCVAPSYGSRSTAYEGLTFHQAVRVARQHGFLIDILCTDGRANIGQPMHTAGQRWVWAAMNKGRIIFARTP